uniref:(California timema) hypothetical protein n=1 Tax=Timema californicum TaxID=61474 RepID=A0A7R9JIG7_TIMCA|nr:unnamed protein product [Timema californicum]
MNNGYAVSIMEDVSVSPDTSRTNQSVSLKDETQNEPRDYKINYNNHEESRRYERNYGTSYLFGQISGRPFTGELPRNKINNISDELLNRHKRSLILLSTLAYLGYKTGRYLGHNYHDVYDHFYDHYYDDWPDYYHYYKN